MSYALNVIKDKNETIKKFIDNLNTKIHEISSANIPISETNYDIWLSMIERVRDLLNIDEEFWQAISYQNNNLYEGIQNIRERLDKLAVETNKNRAKFGLKGQIKRGIEKNEIMPTANMTFEQEHAYRMPYAETPSKIGGKKRKPKRSKTKRTKMDSRNKKTIRRIK